MLCEPREELAPTRAPGGIQQQGCRVPWVLVPVLVPSCQGLPLPYLQSWVLLFLLDFSRQQETSPSAHITPGVFLGWRKTSLQAFVCPISDTSDGAELTQSLAVELHGSAGSLQRSATWGAWWPPPHLLLALCPQENQCSDLPECHKATVMTGAEMGLYS